MLRKLLDVLARAGYALNGFGTVPEYEVPHRGDHAQDFAVIGEDIRRVVDQVEEATASCIKREDERC